MSEMLQNPILVTVFICVIAVLCVLIVELNYRFFAKRMLDVIFSGLFIVITSPVMAVLAIMSKQREGKVFEQTPVLGHKGKIVYLTSFYGIDGGMSKLARLIDIFMGRLSFVGVRAMSINDGALISDEDMDRFNARPGIICSLAVKGSDTLTYDESFALDKRYARRSELFGDIWIMIRSLIYVLRGERGVYLGELADKTYGETLLEHGVITEAQLTEAISLAQSALPHNKE